MKILTSIVESETPQGTQVSVEYIEITCCSFLWRLFE